MKICKKYLPLGRYRVFYFGSRANGKAGPRSDFDIGIEAENEIPLDTMFHIRDELNELEIFHKIDVVDFKNVSDEFKTLAKRHIEVIYEQ